jgi:uncharacterized protein YggE
VTQLFGRTLAALVAALVLVPSLALAQQARVEESTVSTMGEGIVIAVPDRAWITLSAESRAGNPREAQRRNTEAFAPVIAKLKSAGIPDEAIRTIGYDLQQEFDFVQGRRVSRGFVARNTVEVRVDAIDRVGEYLEIAVATGATSVGDIRFDLKDRGKVEREALRLATEDARARAEVMTQAAGRTIERILRIESIGIPSRPMPMRMERDMAMVGQANAAAAPPAISAGQMEIRTQVTLTAVIK